MDLLTTFIIAVGLGMDVFAVSLGIGTTESSRSARPFFRVSFHTGLFQGGMTLLGWLAGSTIAAYISQVDHWIALILLAIVGGRMIQSGLSSDVEAQNGDPTRGKTLVMLCIATSIDAMAVGLSLAMLNVNVLTASLIIGLTSSAMSVIGLLIGNGLGSHFGKRMEVLGGILLIGIGLRILLSHLL